MSYSTSEFKPGLKVLVDNDPCTIIENEFVKPGKGQAFNRIKVRNLKTGRVLGDTAQGGTKPATLETGAIVKVPLFIDKGELLKIDTRTGEYVSRAKD